MSLNPLAPTGLLPQAGTAGYRSQLSNTTCFFRNLAQLETLADVTALTWPQACTIEVLHIGGSIGCEALSFLIALRERAPHLEVRSLSTDFLPANTDFGRQGIYPAHLFDEVFPGEGGDPHGWRDRWFEAAGDALFRPRERLQAGLRFETADAAESGVLPSADVVFCQNVLIHLDRPRAEPVLDHALAAARPRAVLACAGMDLDLKPRVRAAGFIPFTGRIDEIHDGWRACRHHWRTEPGVYYFELEDLDRSRPDWADRYAQIFLRP